MKHVRVWIDNRVWWIYIVLSQIGLTINHQSPRGQALGILSHSYFTSIVSGINHQSPRGHSHIATGQGVTRD